MLSLLAQTKEDFFMFYNVVVNDWGETTYVPTTLSNLLLVLIIAALLAGAMLLAGKHRRLHGAALAEGSAQPGKSAASADMAAVPKRSLLSVKQLTFCAMALALGTVLSNLKLYDFPWGGSVTLLSMLVICLPGYFFGLGAGIMTGVAYGVLQLLVDPYVLYPLQLVVDYLLAFGALGLSGLFTGTKGSLIKGYIAGILGRYVFAVISGWIFFGTYAWEGWPALPYSLVYNGIYIFAEAAITLAILAIPAVGKMLGRLKRMANEA